jgi:(+)-beta-caryophyllene/(+)-caryolan-1-ol synthase
MWEWIDGHDICSGAAERQRMRATEGVLCMALYYPDADAVTFERLCQWLGWAFVADNVIDNPPVSIHPHATDAVIDPMVAVLDGGPAATPLAAALADVRSQVMAGRSTAWRDEFTQATRQWLWSAYAHAVHHASGQRPTLTDYQSAAHRHASGYPMTLALCEYATGTDLAARVRNLPAYTVMRRAAADHLGLVNDLYSAHIEDPSERYHNMVFVVARQHRISIADAAEQVTDSQPSAARPPSPD